MTDNSNALNENTEISENQEEKFEPNITLTFLRCIICCALIFVCFFLKNQNTKIFNQIAYWYKTNICYESVSRERVSEELKDLYQLALSNFSQLSVYIKK